MQQVKIYYSAAIRGPAGDKATEAEMQINLRTASDQATLIQKLFGELITVYCPHQHDRLIQILWKQGHITTAPILQADLQIQNDCDMTIVNNTISSSGVDLEIQNAKNQPCHPVYFIGDVLTDNDIVMLATSITKVLIRKVLDCQ